MANKPKPEPLGDGLKIMHALKNDSAALMALQAAKSRMLSQLIEEFFREAGVDKIHGQPVGEWVAKTSAEELNNSAHLKIKSMANKEYLERLKLAVEHLHGCSARHASTQSVTEIFQGKPIWQGHVEVFEITGHAKAKRCFAWSHREGKDGTGERFVAVLEIPPVNSAQDAVKVSIARDVKSGYKN